jgi:tetratricopeptide (TPR) repeat protein
MKKAIAIQEKHFDSEHPNLAIHYSNLATVEQNLGDLAEARRLMKKAIVIEEKHFDPEHPTLALRYWNLACIEQDFGAMEQARDLARRAYRIQFKRLGPEHWLTQRVREWLEQHDPDFRPPSP